MQFMGGGIKEGSKGGGNAIEKKRIKMKRKMENNKNGKTIPYL
jgi:hypothetical protein